MEFPPPEIKSGRQKSKAESPLLFPPTLPPCLAHPNWRRGPPPPPSSSFLQVPRPKNRVSELTTKPIKKKKEEEEEEEIWRIREGDKRKTKEREIVGLNRVLNA